MAVKVVKIQNMKTGSCLNRKINIRRFWEPKLQEIVRRKRGGGGEEREV